MSRLTDSKAWKKLEDHYKKTSSFQMRELFKNDPDRFKRFSVKFKDILLDYSKNRITSDTLTLLLSLAEEQELKKGIDDMFSGKKINITENRAVLHTALRNFSGEPVYVDGEDVMPKVKEVQQKMKKFCETVR